MRQFFLSFAGGLIAGALFLLGTAPADAGDIARAPAIVAQADAR